MRGLPTFDDPNLIVGAEHFSDAGAYRLRDDLLIVQSLDFFPPLVDDPFLFGQIAAANSLSDLYAMGAQPTTALNIVGFPDDQLDLAILGKILQGGAERVIEAGAVVVGGHTVRDAEIKYGLSVTGQVKPERLLTNRQAMPGDSLVLTKGLGTGFVTTAYKADQCPEATLRAATDSMVQLNRAGSQAAQTVSARAATDVTGFGLAGHACEMAEASGVTLAITLDRLPTLPGVAELIRTGKYATRASATNRSYTESKMRIAAGADPTQLELLFDAQTSGGLLISVAPEHVDQLIDTARTAGAIAACQIGSALEREDATLIVE